MPEYLRQEESQFRFQNKVLFEQIRKSQNYIIIPLDHRILLQMMETKEVSELRDKIIVATAKLLDTPLITKDAVLADLKTIATVW